MTQVKLGIDRLELLAASRPGDPMPTAQLAVAYAQAGAFDSASEALRKTRARLEGCVRLGMTELAVHVARMLHEGLGGLETLLLRLEFELHREPRGELDGLLAELASMQFPTLDLRIQAATLALAAGRHAVARGLIEAHAHAQVEAHVLYIHTLIGCSDAGGAAREAREALVRWGERDFEPRARSGVRASAEVDLHVLLGVAELHAGRTDASIAALSEALRLAPERAETYYNLGLALVDAGSLAAAAGIIEAGLELAPQDVRLAALRARVTAR